MFQGKIKFLSETQTVKTNLPNQEKWTAIFQPVKFSAK